MFGSIVDKLLHHGVQTVVHHPRVVGAVGEQRVQGRPCGGVSVRNFCRGVKELPRDGVRSRRREVLAPLSWHGTSFVLQSHLAKPRPHPSSTCLLGDEEPSLYVNLVVFGNGARLNVQARERVWYMNELQDTIESYRTVRMAEGTVSEIVEHLNEERLSGYGLRVQHRRQIEEYIGCCITPC